MNLAHIQEELQRQKLDGWLLFDHHNRDPISYRVLGLSPASHVTRRWYYLIPAQGEPRALVHRIESHLLDGLPGDKLLYSGWREHDAGLAGIVSGCSSLAMQYSPRCEILAVALADAGTVEAVRSFGCEVVSSAELVQHFDALLSESSYQSHLRAGALVDSVRAEAFHLIAERLRSKVPVTEYEVASFIRERFRSGNLYSGNGPIVACGAHSGDPHYEPQQESSAIIGAGEFVLIDLWAKLNQPDSIYYDITWTGFCGTEIPAAIQNVFQIVKTARRAASDLVRNSVVLRRQLQGFQVDDAARSHIGAQGFADYFTHRTGHSIGQEVHGNGVNMDNFETHDTRTLLPWSCFSIEPGIYLDRFGVRSEINMFLTATDAVITGPEQLELVTIV